jgi:hypothetical protein
MPIHPAGHRQPHQRNVGWMRFELGWFAIQISSACRSSKVEMEPWS